MNRFAAAFVLLLFSIKPASAQTKTIWQIGRYDQSSREFQAKPRDHVVYRVGRSDWSQDWPADQRVGASYEIQFNLDTAPHGVFSLKASILTFYRGLPALQVQINGHKGIYYLHPKILYTADQRYRSSYAVTIEFPAKYLHAGLNSLALSCVDMQPAYAPPGKPAGVIDYDAITFTNDRNATYNRRAIHAEVMPTIFYRRKAGHLVEIVDAFLRFGGATPAGSAALTINGQRYPAAVPALKDFGEERVEFEIPEWQGTTLGHLAIKAGRHVSFNMPVTAARKWTLFVVPHTHLDIGYTDYQGKVAEIHARTLQEAVDRIQKHPDFRFSTDGSWNVQQFLTTRSKERQEDLLKLTQEDKISVPADYANLLTGYASLETLYRSLYYSKWLSRTYGVPFVYATTTDVPTYTGTYPSILADAGIKYWAVGGNNDRAPVLANEQWDEKSPFWWEGPDGQKVLFWYSRGYAQIGMLFGLSPQQASIYDSLPIFLQAYSRPEYKPDVALIYGAQAENTDLYPGLATFATTWNRTYAYPKLQYATFPEFFRYIDEHYGTELATYKGDMGPYWEDGIGSDAYYAAEDRQNQNNVLSAEVASTASHVVNPDLHPPKAELENAWNNIILFAEHTWTAGNSISQPDSEEVVKQLAVKDDRATQAKFEIEDITNRTMSQLANDIQIPARTLVVFNALNWKRDALVETDLREHEELIDLSTQKIVPMEILSNKENFIHVRFLASDLPAVGYKCFQIRSRSNSSPVEPTITMNPVIENQYYRVTVDPESGSIKSIFDKQLQRELVNSDSSYKFGQYLYVTGGDGQTRMIHPFKSLPLGKLTIHPAVSGAYLGTRKTPWGDSIRLRSSDVNTPTINLEVLLFNRQKEIEFRYSVQKNYTTAKEGVYFAFPIAVTPPRFVYATQQGWINPAKDMLKGASLEWFSIQKWMAADDAHLAVGIVPVDASLASFGDINRGEWPGEFHPKTSTIFSYAMNNYWHTNYRAGQGGTFTFRYVLTSAQHLDPVALTRLGWDSMEPPELDHVIHNDKVGNPARPLPAEGTSFLQIDAPNIVLSDWKLAEDGKGTILRLEETAGRSTTATIRLPHSLIRSASLCNAVEDNMRPLNAQGDEVQVAFSPYQVQTIRLNLDFKH